MTKAKAEALVVFSGGPRDGQTDTVASHDVLVIDHDENATYVRSDAQHGDARIYTYAPGDGAALPTGVVSVTPPAPTLARDLAEQNDL